MIRLAYLFTIMLLAIISHDCNHAPPISAEPENLIYDRQSNAQYSNDGKRIVFEGLYDSLNAIHFIDKDGNYLGHILDAVKKQRYISSPSWGPNNRLTVSIEGCLYTVDINGDSLNQLTYSAQDFSCSWSRDGKHIAYTKSICDPECGIAIYDLDAKTTRVIGKYGGYASWDMNSERVYYYHTLFVKRQDSNISDYKGFVFKRIDINTLKEDSLFYVSDEGLWLQDCSVSPDEREILFAAIEGSPPQVNIWKISLEDHSMIEMTQTGGHHPSYSPDRTTIVYTNTNILEGGLWLMNRDGSNKRRFTILNR